MPPKESASKPRTSFKIIPNLLFYVQHGSVRQLRIYDAYHSVSRRGWNYMVERCLEEPKNNSTKPQLLTPDLYNWDKIYAQMVSWTELQQVQINVALQKFVTAWAKYPEHWKPEMATAQV